MNDELFINLYEDIQNYTKSRISLLISHNIIHKTDADDIYNNIIDETLQDIKTNDKYTDHEFIDDLISTTVVSKSACNISIPEGTLYDAFVMAYKAKIYDVMGYDINIIASKIDTSIDEVKYALDIFNNNNA